VHGFVSLRERERESKGQNKGWRQTNCPMFRVLERQNGKEEEGMWVTAECDNEAMNVDE